MAEEVKEQAQPLDPKDLSKPRIYDVDVDEVLRYELEHADEIAAEMGKAFEMVGVTTEEQQELASATAAPAGGAKTEQGAERESTITKIAKLNVGARVK